MAKWIPSSWRPGASRSRGSVAPPARSTASYSSTSDRADDHLGVGGHRLGHLRRRLPHRHPTAELDPLGRHLLDPPVEHRLFHLERRDPVAEQPTRSLGPFEDHHPVAGPGQLLGGGQPGRARADDGHRLAGRDGRAHRLDPPLGPGPFGDLVLDALDGHRVVADPEHAGPFARGRAQPAGELGEIVGGVQTVGRLRPVVPVDQVVPFGYEVAERAPLVTEGDPAVHAPSPLLAGRFLRERFVDLPPVAEPYRHRAADR